MGMAGSVLAFAAACFAMGAASAADCPGHPGALGTSRTLVVDPRKHPRIGAMQYPETLPLADHEIVLTFDDGPLPRNSRQILEILASQCVKATFFTIGRMAQNSPEGVRKLREAGHTIGTHTQTHPLSMNHMTSERAQQEIDDGIASVKAALGDDADTTLAPFFRIPGLLRADNVEDYLASQGIQTWSSDFLADDWRHISSSRVFELAIKRLEARGGKGILLLHDIQARTVAALPRILETLKARGYRIVHVVPATAERPATPTDPQDWLVHRPSDNGMIAHWPPIPNFVFANLGSLPAPARSDFEPPNESATTQKAPMPWPQSPPFATEPTTALLPTPEPSLFDMPDNFGAALRRTALSSRQGPKTAPLPLEARSTHIASGRTRHQPHRRELPHRGIKVTESRAPTAMVHRAPSKHLKKRSV